MNKIEIQMPENVRYMSEATETLTANLPSFGKYILDKSLTGCGGTEFFLNSGRPLVLVSPRTGVLLSKSQQHPECYLFRDASKSDVQTLKNNLRKYLDRPVNIFGNDPSIILVTLDSAKYVIEELKYRNIIDQFLFLHDEFQCLIGDAAFKGDVDLEFLKMLDAEAKNICYMSATPIDDTYLRALPQFQNVDFYKLKWDPNVIVEPTIKEIMMEEGETARIILRRIISDYRRYGYFARKIDGNVTLVEAKEVVVFVNEVRTIVQIIEDNELKPHEVTILISASNKYVNPLKKKGFVIDNQSTDRSNPRNTTYTFCSKASFEGRDFYSTSAFTYIFIDGTKDWEIHDTTIEIPQMLGRQRLDANPFKYNATIYYRTKPSTLTINDYLKKIESKLYASEALVNNYNNADETLKASLINLVKGQDPSNRYQSNYLDVIDNAHGKYTLEINLLVTASEHNLAVNKTQFYSNPLFLTTAIHNQVANCNTKPQELRDFEKQFNKMQAFDEKMRLYSNFLSNYPQYEATLLSNPFIDIKYHSYYASFGLKELSNLGYNEDAIEWELCRIEIISQCQTRFQKGAAYALPYVKKELQEIYNNLNLGIKATAKQLEDYLPVESIQRTLPDGTRPRRPRMLLIK